MDTFKKDYSPIDPQSKSLTSRKHSKAYLRHLFNVKEQLGAQIASLHNLSFFLGLVEEARVQIIKGTFSTWKDTQVRRLDVRL
jgi:queuine tRNA-ribosyltransferase